MDKIRELREIIPVGVIEGKKLLESANYDLDKAVNIFIRNSIADLKEKTGKEDDALEAMLADFKFDIPSILRQIRIEQYDENFKEERLDGLDEFSLSKIDEWIHFEDHEGILSALLHSDFFIVESFIRKALELEYLADALLEQRNELSVLLKGHGSATKRLRVTNDFKKRESYKKVESLFESSMEAFDWEYQGVKRNYEKRR